MITLRDVSLVEHSTAQAGTSVTAKSLHGKSAVRAAMASSEGAAYLDHLDHTRQQLLEVAARRLGRPLQPSHVYRYGANGMALELTAGEAAAMAQLPGVAALRRERIEHVHTDAGPQWIGANALWTGQVDGIAATRGEGSVIGIIDTGINPVHAAFAATGGDGYKHTNPRGKFYGLCASEAATCNDKLIGIYDFSNEGTHGVDVDGHGSHVSGIAAGNAISATLHGMTADLTRNISGVAPHANLIMYKACNATPIDSSGDGTCAESWLVAAIDQAIADQVDVINYSIGGGTTDPYVLLGDRTSDVAAFFQARAAGVVIVTSAGNDGPDPNTLDEPSNAPWVIGVANASHNRRFINSLVALSGAPGAPGDLHGQGFTAGYGPAAIVYAADYGFALCGTGATQTEPTGASNPWPAGTFHGEIVVCDRGFYGRVEKGYNVKAAGAGGMILANAASNGESVEADDHYLPAVHLGYAEGQALESWLHVSGSHSGAISGVSAQLDNRYGDVLEGSSSRGPYGFTGGVLKPDVTAPGTNILSAAPSANQLAILTGTSMASPHVAGSAALILSAHRDWDPAQVESALLGTALAGSVRKEDGITAAAPTDAGTGRVQPALASSAGLYLPLNTPDFAAGNGAFANNPTQHGDLGALNRIGLENEHCFQRCTFARTVTDMSGGGTWTASFSASAGASFSMTPSQFTLAAGASQSLAIVADVSDPHLPGTWVNGRILLHKISGGNNAADIALTAAVHADGGSPPPFQDIDADAPSGLATLTLAGLPALAQATYSTTSLDPGSTTTLMLGADPAPGSPFDLPGAGKQVTFFPHYSAAFQALADGTSGQNGRLQIIEVQTPDAPLVDLYVGIDSNGDGVAQSSELLCNSAATNASGSIARCVVDLAGTMQPVWALVQVAQGSTTASYSITLRAAQPFVSSPINTFSNSGGPIVTGPGHVDALATFPLRLSWNIPRPDRYFGAVLVDGAPGLFGQSALLPFAITRHAGGNDIVDPDPTAGTLEPGETLTHTFIDVPPAASRLSLTGSTDVAQPAGRVAGYLIRTDFPPSSVSAQIAAAPGADATAVNFSFQGADASSNAVSVPVSAGRWYVVASNPNSSRIAYALNATTYFDDANPSPVAPGAYFNPQRAGSGIFISQAGNVQALDWYTYLEDGTPTWYQAQALLPDPAGAAWTAPLFRVNWDGAAVNARTVVGDVIVTFVNATDLMFSWHLDGQAGSERLTRLGAGACPSFNGVATNFNGAWFAPAQGGYGMDIAALPDLQFAAFYFYDSLGIARWGTGGTAPFAVSSTINLTQNQGFCPSCDFASVTSRPLGTLAIGYSDAGSGTYSTNLRLNAPLSGTWTISQPMSRLTGSPACAP